MLNKNKDPNKEFVKYGGLAAKLYLLQSIVGIVLGVVSGVVFILFLLLIQLTS